MEKIYGKRDNRVVLPAETLFTRRQSYMPLYQGENSGSARGPVLSF
jgi:hypothetical protein